MVTKSLIVVLALLAMVDRSLGLCPRPCSYSECGPPPTNCSFGVTFGVCGCCKNVCAKGPGEQCDDYGPYSFSVSVSCGTDLECKGDSYDKPGVCGNKVGPGEKCGGPQNEYGSCKSGLVCKQPCSEMYPNDYDRPGVCSNKSGPGEQCSQYGWYSRCGECENGLVCKQPCSEMYPDDFRRAGVCSNKSGSGEQCGGGDWRSRCGKCESGLTCHRPLQDPYGKPGVCGNISGPGERCVLYNWYSNESTCERGLRCRIPYNDYVEFGGPQPGVCSNRVHSDQTPPPPTTAAPTTAEPSTSSPPILHRLILT